MSNNSLPYNNFWPMGKKDQKLADDAAKVGWYRFAEVDKFVLPGHKLYRSSCPGYDGSNDASQKLTPQRAAFLTTKKIDSIISFNEHSYTAAELKILSASKIAYKHVEVKDFGVASDADYDAAWKFFKAHKSSLVHCGFGWGRTGTAICVLQLYSTQGKSPDEKLWGEVDGGDQVEKDGQKVALKKIKAGLASNKIKP